MSKISTNHAKYTSHNPLKRIMLAFFLKKVATILYNLKTDNILDAGCGEGHFIKYYQDQYGQEKNWSGIDLSATSLELAKQQLKNVNLSTGDIYNLPFLDNNFDVVVCLEVLEHLSKPAEALNELKRVTKKYCLISVPWEPYFSLGNTLSGKNLSRLGRPADHLNPWHQKQITQLLSQHFNIIKATTSFPWLIFLLKK